MIYLLLRKPSYSPDLAPSDLHLLPNLKKFVSGKRYSSSTEVERAIDGYFHSLPEYHFQEGILMLEKRWTKKNESTGSAVHDCWEQWSRDVLPQENRLPEGHMALPRGKTTIFGVRLWRIVLLLKAEIRAAVGTTVTQRAITNRLFQSQFRARRPVA
ncbi:histone-lysine N-methyltransferase SETMAR [Trichonephila clavipes]|nr:histone-lysine N-methyltransferase SETMAR [Trichonephila clavipes]